MSFRQFLPVFSLIIGVGMGSSCTQKATQEAVSDTLSYQMEKWERHSDTCVREDSLCATSKFEYPVFTDKNSLNQHVQQLLLEIFQNEGEEGTRPTNLKELAQKFVKEYQTNMETTKKDMAENNMLGDMVAIPWNQEGYVKVLPQRGQVLAMHVNTYWFMGGAHPISMEYYWNFDNETLKQLTLEDIFEPGYDAQLLQVAEQLFRKQENIASDKPLDQESGYFFENGKFLLNDNFQLTETGIKFLWNVYEIKSYAEGITELTIPYAQINTLLKPVFRR
jgi:Protein of unknown function (DUF3298)/Deacetylase PdaC